MSSRTDMLDELVLRLLEIDGTPDYNYTNRKASWKTFKLPDTTQHFPETYVLVDDSSMVGGQIGTNNQMDVIPVLIWGYVKAKVEVQLVAENFLADIAKGIALHRSTGNVDMSLNNTCGAFMIAGKGISGDLTSELRTVELLLNVTMHTPIQTI